MRRMLTAFAVILVIVITSQTAMAASVHFRYSRKAALEMPRRAKWFGFALSHSLSPLLLSTSARGRMDRPRDDACSAREVARLGQKP